MAADPELLLRYLRRLVIRQETLHSSDAMLLSSFISQRDEKAFSTLVDRHGPMVFHVCRRVLGNLHDAEDAFQAAFLVLARKASSVHPRESLTAWMHGVAYRVALKARSARGRRNRDVHNLPEAGTDKSPDPLTDLSARELFALVDEEVRRLPEVYRLPVILCCLEGRSQEEAASQLGWTPGSVKGRLERGRARLHNRLVRRGLMLSAALMAAELSRGVVAAAVVDQMLAATARAAVAFSFGQTVIEGTSNQAAVLAGEVVARRQE
jgi:RNA polymerase sigma factor (sigma-70 family)